MQGLDEEESTTVDGALVCAVGGLQIATNRNLFANYGTFHPYSSKRAERLEVVGVQSTESVQAQLGFSPSPTT